MSRLASIGPRSSGRVLLAAAVTIAIAAALTARPAAAVTAKAPVLDVQATQTVTNVTDAVLDQIPVRGRERLYALVANPPAVNVYQPTGSTLTQVGSVPLPSDSSPQTAAFDRDGMLQIVDGLQGRLFEVDVVKQVVEGIVPLPNAFIGGIAFGSKTQVATDFGFGPNPGAILYGTGFGQRLQLPGDSAPYGVAWLPFTARPTAAKSSSAFVAVNAQVGDIFYFAESQLADLRPVLALSDAVQPLDIAVNPINLNLGRGAPRFPILVTAPQQGQVFQAPGLGRPWQQILPGVGIGNPSRVDANCSRVALTDVQSDTVTVLGSRPGGGDCEQIGDVAPGAKQPATLPPDKFLFYAFWGMSGTLKLIIPKEAILPKRVNRAAGPRATAAARRPIRSRPTKLSLDGGEVARVRLKFSRSARARLKALGRPRVKGVLKIKVRTASGQKAKIREKVRVKVR